ncbi:hypothetical protein BJX63DRAFT_436089 [Aspergillus granulosus]|uniref:Uncharacterized protein n=1 Tax=Aspergillus granulosus TaxID=176169 RepID=A0ABR4GZ55_9EURO
MAGRVLGFACDDSARIRDKTPETLLPCHGVSAQNLPEDAPGKDSGLELQHEPAIASLPNPESDWDRKQGWPVTIAGSSIFFVYLGLTYSYGIVQLHLAEARLASISTLSFIGSLGAAMEPLSGMLVAQIISLAGYRIIACI